MKTRTTSKRCIIIIIIIIIIYYYYYLFISFSIYIYLFIHLFICLLISLLLYLFYLLLINNLALKQCNKKKENFILFWFKISGEDWKWKKMDMTRISMQTTVRPLEPGHSEQS